MSFVIQLRLLNAFITPICTLFDIDPAAIIPPTLSSGKPVT
ncbi:hypothetical protein QWZ16_09670 [Vibrio ostreicida]|uniref:Uncharacterized protein n=1 Tax=Vibrio ostreicida TaxID=526588 RepID=A0ABT8BUY6_9VIBR|nr:hypothetical protein [Vibrio ostreicida]MDN3609965.1 hypothetical protein [Vibrio ostreicida]